MNEPKSYIEWTWKVLMSEIEVNPNISITNTKAGLEGVQLRPASPYLLVSRNCFEILIVCIKVNFYSYLYYILGQSRRLSKYFPNYKWLLPSRQVPPHVFNQLFFFNMRMIDDEEDDDDDNVVTWLDFSLIRCHILVEDMVTASCCDSCWWKNMLSWWRPKQQPQHYNNNFTVEG